MSIARKLAARTAPLSAWNYTTEERDAIVRRNGNAYGQSVLFIDGTRVFIPSGSPVVNIVTPNVTATEAYRNLDFKMWSGLSDYIATALQDLQYSENDQACEDGRVALDVGTIYDIPAETFAKLRDDYAAFHTAAGVDRDEWIAQFGAESFGSDFHMTRVGHGVGYWDRDAGELGERLTKLCEAYRSEGPYSGDDGRTYA